jgi:hypothetical protein
MGRKIYITTEMSTDEALIEIGTRHPIVPLLWPWFLLACDDWGRSEASVIHLKAEVFPMYEHVTLDVIETALQEFHAAGLITLYTTRKKRYFFIEPESWYRWQTHIRTEKREKDASRCPAPPSEPASGDADSGEDARTPATSSEDARDCAQPREDARTFNECCASPSPSPSPSDSAHAADAGVALSAAQTGERTDRRPRQYTSIKAERLAKLAEAMTAVGLKSPKFTAREAKAAGDLMDAGWKPEQIAQCISDIKHSKYLPGDRLAGGQVSCEFLAGYQRLSNWQDWVDAGRPPQALPQANGKGRPVEDTSRRYEYK